MKEITIEQFIKSLGGKILVLTKDIICKSYINFKPNDGAGNILINLSSVLQKGTRIKIAESDHQNPFFGKELDKEFGFSIRVFVPGVIYLDLKPEPEIPYRVNIKSILNSVDENSLPPELQKVSLS